MVASGKASPHASCSGSSRDSSPVHAGARPCVESVPEPEDSSPVPTWIWGYFWSLPRGVSPRLQWGHACALSSRALAAVSRFPSRGSRVLWLSLELFPQGSPTCHRGVSRSLACKWKLCRENRFPWNGLRHLGDSGNGGTTLDFLSPFLWRVPPLEMRQERGEFFPHHAGKGSFLSR